MVATMSDMLHCKIIAVRIVDKRSILNKVKKDKITIYIHALFEGFAFASGMFFAGFAFTSTRILLFFINIFLLLDLGSENRNYLSFNMPLS